MSWNFETEPEFQKEPDWQKKLDWQKEFDWIDKFVRAEVQPLDYVLESPYEVRNPKGKKLQVIEREAAAQ
jgi:acyl-CoA dehydrogenase